MIDPASKGRLPAPFRAVCTLSPAAKMTYNTYMENTTPSPKTQAVIDAYESATDKYKALAAVIHAVAGQVVPEDGDPIYGLTPARAERQVVRRKFLAIAAELETL